MRKGLAAMFAVALCGASGVAHAADEVRVHLPACTNPPFDYDEFTDVLRVELAPDPVVVVGGTEPATLDVEMPCVGASYVTLRVMGAPRPAVRRMDIGDLSAATRPRGIAVVAAELVRSARTSEPPAEPPPAPPPPAAPPPKIDAPRIEPRERPTPPPPWDLRAAAEARIFVAAPTALFGAALGGRFHRARGTLGLLRGSADDALGRTDLTLGHGSFGLELWRLGVGRFELVVAPRVGVGMIAADATASMRAASRSTREAYLDGAIELEARIRIGAAAWVILDADGGYARGLVATADGRVVAKPDGVFFGARLGIAIAP